MIGIGIIGLGVMGGQHIAAYTAAAAVGVGCRIVAVADERSERRAGQAATAGNVQSGGPSFGLRGQPGAHVFSKRIVIGLLCGMMNYQSGVVHNSASFAYSFDNRQKIEEEANYEYTRMNTNGHSTITRLRCTDS